ncbi:hypothetical protein E5676_scaffold244G00120 [Cucumis melo var. makuwa]|uniref:Uncharacterized protein n=1 Tax=Cucumis melo var. makuwa TaxID=1194695 RepID=A0A5D3DV65_CUCMM|nr:hypothetical protein E5676_scaffold244G00120 [Cucumis melo var. makuwa]
METLTNLEEGAASWMIFEGKGRWGLEHRKRFSIQEEETWTGTLREQRCSNVHGSNNRWRSKTGKLRVAAANSIQGEETKETMMGTGTFTGEDLQKPIKEFHIVCGGVKPHGVME